MIIVASKSAGLKLIDKSKFQEEKTRIDLTFKTAKNLDVFERLSLFADRHFMLYLLYRRDLIFFWLVCGGLFTFLMSDWIYNLF